MSHKIKPTAVSIRASRAYLEALRRLGKDTNTPVADLVKQAVDQAYSEALSPYISFFREADERFSQLTKGDTQ